MPRDQGINNQGQLRFLCVCRMSVCLSLLRTFKYRVVSLMHNFQYSFFMLCKDVMNIMMMMMIIIIIIIIIVIIIIKELERN